MTTPFIHPNTTGVISVEVDDPDDVPILDATVVGDVYSPESELLSGDMPFVHSGSGVYIAEVDPAWSLTVEGLPRLGRYHALIQIDTPEGWRETVQFVWDCKFE